MSENNLFLLNILCQQQFKETSAEVLLDLYSPTPDTKLPILHLAAGYRRQALKFD